VRQLQGVWVNDVSAIGLSVLTLIHRWWRSTFSSYCVRFVESRQL